MSFTVNTTARTNRVNVAVSDAAVAQEYLRLDLEAYPEDALSEEERALRARTRLLVQAAGTAAHAAAAHIGGPGFRVNVSGHAEADPTLGGGEYLMVELIPVADDDADLPEDDTAVPVLTTETGERDGGQG